MIFWNIYIYIYIDRDFNAVKVESKTKKKSVFQLKGDAFLTDIFAGENKVSRYFFGTSDNAEMVYYGAPVYDQDKIIGALIVKDDLNSLKNSLQFPALDINSDIKLVNQDGRIIFDTQEQDVGKQLGDTLNISDSINSKLEDFVKKEEYGLFRLDNHNIYLASCSVLDDNWYAVCMIPYTNTGLDSLTIIVIGCILLMIVILGGLTLYMNNKVYKGEQKVNDMAFYNPITHAYNKNGFFRLFPKKFENDALFSLVVLDIHDFKFINHSFGFQIGNELLCHVIDVLKQNLNDDESYYHSESDQFGFLLHTQNVDEIKMRVMKIMDEISAYNLFPNQHHPIHCYCGIKILNMFSRDVNMAVMIDRAQIAKISVQNLHGNHYAFYDEQMYRKAQRKNEIEKKMKFALENHEFKVYIQPKYDLKKDCFCGGEALVRWKDEKGDIVSPGEFIPIFEQNGFISYVDMYIFEKVCAFQNDMREMGYDVVPISLNQSKISIFEENYIEHIKEVLTKYNVQPGEIIIEITEGVSIHDIHEVENILLSLKKLGLKISMDDFGSGYSSLNILKELPIDELKLDRLFLNETKYREKSENIMRNIINLAKECHMKVVCEGVETIENVEMLKSMNCDIAQGFYYARPMPLQEFLIDMYKSHV